MAMRSARVYSFPWAGLRAAPFVADSTTRPCTRPATLAGEDQNRYTDRGGDDCLRMQVVVFCTSDRVKGGARC